jgi:hypothetical protein
MNVRVTNGVRRELEARSAQLRDKTEAHRVMAYAGAELCRDKAITLAASNVNRFGAKSSFWDRMRNQVRAYATSVCGTVALAAEWGHRYFGGTVRPKGGKRNLTIPVDGGAYGRRAGEIEGLELMLRRKKGTGELLKFLGEKGTGRLFYLLKPEATQKGNKDVLPTVSQLELAGREALEIRLRRPVAAAAVSAGG